MRTLVCGDPHATPDALDEMERLIDLIITHASLRKVDHVIFLGDQYHTHSVIQLSVLAFWDRSFKRMKEAGLSVIALVGNHDRGGVDGEKANAMMLHSEVDVVNEPVVKHGILFVPYTHDKDEFVRACQLNPTKLVICHQTFSGSFFENGFQLPDGIEPNDIPQEQILSGHIHSEQESGKVKYPGAPRWRSVADANTERHLWVIEHAEDGSMGSIHKIPTATACRPIYTLQDTCAKPAVVPSGEATIIVDVHGTQAYVDARKRELEEANPGIRIRTFAETERVLRAKESDGLPVALKKFVASFEAKNGTPNEELWMLASQRISWINGVA